MNYVLVVFLVFSIIAKTTSQKSASFGLNSRVVLQPNTWYTCPANKKAKVKGTFMCTGTGAGAQARLSVAGVIIHRWIPTFVSTADMGIQKNTDLYVDGLGVSHFPPVNTNFEFEYYLAAGETVVTSQDSGTNAEFNGNLEVTESPV